MKLGGRCRAGEKAGAGRMMRTQRYRSGHCDRNLATASGGVTLRTPRTKNLVFETAIIECCRRRAGSVAGALIEMVPPDVSVCRAQNIAEALWVLWGGKVSFAAISELNEKARAYLGTGGANDIIGREISVCLRRRHPFAQELGRRGGKR